MRARLAALPVLVALAVPVAAEAKASRARLASFASCAQLLDYAKRHAVQVLEPWGLPSRGVAVAPPVPLPVPTAGGDPAVPQPTRPAVEAFSDTNVQEPGVDEPDIVKTDGRRLFALAGDRLYAVDLKGATPRVAGSIALDGYASQLLLRGDRLLAIGTRARPYPLFPARPVARGSMTIDPAIGATVLTEVDVSDLAHMTVRRTEEIDGYVVGARRHGDLARIVIAAAPRQVAMPNLGPNVTREQVRTAGRRVIGATGLRTWMPRTRFASRLTGRRFDRRAARCRDVRRPPAFSGLGMLTIATVDLERGLPVRDSEAILSDARTVYASRSSVYVATERWFHDDGTSRVPGGRSTAVHRFALAGAQTRYRSSGLVTGFLLNQFSLSEHEGAVRVATTTDRESHITTLRERDGRLVEAGRLDGLGKDERIYAVRFLGDLGFVVTFRQVDPLFAIDLSDPARPRVRGELELLGYSAYLHPAGDGLLLGIGQSATPEGRTEGAQLQLFDVSNLAAPRRIAQAKLGMYAFSEAEADHHAFLFWPKTGLAVVPVTMPGGAAAAGFDARRSGGLREIGRIAHPGAAPVRRSIVVGSRLLTISEAGVKTSRLDTLADVAWAPFPS